MDQIQVSKVKFVDSQEIGRVRERKKPRGGGRNESSIGKGNLASGFESMLDARIHGAKVGARTHSAEVTRLGATDLGSEVPGRAQQGILGGVDVVGTSVPEYMAPSSAPQILAPTSVPCILRRAWIQSVRPSFPC